MHSRRALVPVALLTLVLAGGCRDDDGEAINPRTEDPPPAVTPSGTPTPTPSATPRPTP